MPGISWFQRIAASVSVRAAFLLRIARNCDKIIKKVHFLVFPGDAKERRRGLGT